MKTVVYTICLIWLAASCVSCLVFSFLSPEAHTTYNKTIDADIYTVQISNVPDTTQPQDFVVNFIQSDEEGYFQYLKLSFIISKSLRVPFDSELVSNDFTVRLETPVSFNVLPHVAKRLLTNKAPRKRNSQQMLNFSNLNLIKSVWEIKITIPSQYLYTRLQNQESVWFSSSVNNDELLHSTKTFPMISDPSLIDEESKPQDGSTDWALEKDLGVMFPTKIKLSST